METQYLFAYGTLKSDQPEHVLHCEPPRSVEPAQAPGALWRLREGYPILQIEPLHSPEDASTDPVADWQRALAAPTVPSPEWHAAHSWIEGELFAYPLTCGALRRMDEWENFAPGQHGIYQRRLIWVRDRRRRPRLAWAYVCFVPPSGAVRLAETRWG